MINRKIKSKIIVLSAMMILFMVALLPIGLTYTQKQNIPLSSTSNISVGVVVTFLDDNGNVVSAPPSFSAFKIGDGVYIHSIKVDVTWEASGSGINWETFELTGGIRFSYFNAYDRWITESQYPISSTAKTGSDSKTFVLGVDICLAGNILDGGWYIKGEFWGTATALDEAGTALSAPLQSADGGSLSGTLNVVWDADLKIVGTWNWYNI